MEESLPKKGNNDGLLRKGLITAQELKSRGFVNIEDGVYDVGPDSVHWYIERGKILLIQETLRMLREPSCDRNNGGVVVCHDKEMHAAFLRAGDVLRDLDIKIGEKFNQETGVRLKIAPLSQPGDSYHD